MHDMNGQNNNQNQEANDDLNRLHQNLADANARMANLQTEHRDVIVVVGATGSGKSTFIGYMQGRHLEMTEDSYGRELIDYPDKPIVDMHSPVIGHSSQAETTFPEAYFMPQNNSCLLDTAGFMDPRGTDTRIMNAVSIKLAVNYASAIRGVVCVISFEDMLRRMDRLSDTLAALRVLFGQYELHPDGLSFVFTGVPLHRDDSIIYNNIRRLLDELEKNHEALNANENAYHLLQYMAHNYNEAVFRADFTRDEGALIERLQDRFQRAPVIPKNEFDVPLGEHERYPLERIAIQIVTDYRAINGEIQAIAQTIENLEEKIAREENKIVRYRIVVETERRSNNDNQQRVNKLEEEIDTLQANITNLEAEEKAKKGQIEKHKNSIDGLRNDRSDKFLKREPTGLDPVFAFIVPPLALFPKVFFFKDIYVPACDHPDTCHAIQNLKMQIRPLKQERSDLQRQLINPRRELNLKEAELHGLKSVMAAALTNDAIVVYVQKMDDGIKRIGELREQIRILEQEQLAKEDELTVKHNEFSLLLQLNEYFHFENYLDEVCVFIDEFDPGEEIQHQYNYTPHFFQAHFYQAEQPHGNQGNTTNTANTNQNRHQQKDEENTPRYYVK